MSRDLSIQKTKNSTIIRKSTMISIPLISSMLSRRKIQLMILKRAKLNGLTLTMITKGKKIRIIAICSEKKVRAKLGPCNCCLVF